MGDHVAACVSGVNEHANTYLLRYCKSSVPHPTVQGGKCVPSALIGRIGDSRTRDCNQWPSGLKKGHKSRPFRRGGGTGIVAPRRRGARSRETEGASVVWVGARLSVSNTRTTQPRPTGDLPNQKRLRGIYTQVSLRLRRGRVPLSVIRAHRGDGCPCRGKKSCLENYGTGAALGQNASFFHGLESRAAIPHRPG